jgi:hypothetical protein
VLLCIQQSEQWASVSVKERKGRNQFPRTGEIPVQSPKYWAKEKDRYLRQLLISDIEEETGRELVVYFSRLDQGITETDADDLSEILQGVETTEVDLLLHTPGGFVDSVEKCVSVLRLLGVKYRVIIPSFAKSGGTLIALSAKEILLGVNSELGPVDAQMSTSEYSSVSAEYIANDESQPKILQEIAKTNVERGKNLAEKYLQIIFAPKTSTPTPENIEKSKSEIESVLTKLSSPRGYGSHGAVIDYAEAKALNLPVVWMAPDSTLWKRVWLLYCLYDFDTKQGDIGKVFEGALYSILRPPLIWD